MAALRYRDEHNKVGYLKKPTGSDDYHQILDFLRASHIRYALTNDPIIFDSLVKQFWSTATLRSPELGPPAILATIDETPYTITEDLVRSQLQLADDGGIDDLPIAEIYSGMDNLGYVTEGKLTFYKNKFSPQWRFLVHTILHCLSTKSGSWDQFGSSLAVALICLSDGRKFNWSSYIFKGMVSNIGNAKKFLMYPRFLQTILGIETSFTRQYHVFKLSSKLFANMKLNFEGQPMQLLAAMLPQDQEGEGAGVAAQAVPPPIPEPIPEPMPEPDQPQDHLSTPPRQQTSDPIAPVFEHGQSSDPNIASFSRVHETDDDPFTSTNVEDEPLGGSFHASPPRSTQAPPAGHTSGGAEDLITLTALSSVVSTLVQKVNSLETELKAHKKLFKDVVGKLVKQVKAMEVTVDSTKSPVGSFYSAVEPFPAIDVGLTTATYTSSSHVKDAKKGKRVFAADVSRLYEMTKDQRKRQHEDVCFVKELQHFNLFSVSQICDKKNKVLFTDSECLVLSPEFKLPNENQVLLKVPRQNNMYSFNLENIVPSGGLACLIAKATTDESNKWHRRLGHVNFKNLNKLVKGNLVRGLPLKLFQNDHTCVACQKGKQHKASCTEDIIDAGDSKKEDKSNQDCFVLPIWPSYSSTTPASKTDDKREDPREEEQVFMDELERLKRQEKEAIEEAKNLRKKFETLVIQEGAAKTSSTNIFSTVSTPAKASSTNLVNTVSIPVSTASPNEGLSLYDPTNLEEDDSEIPPLEDIYQDSTDGIFTTSSFDDEGAVADFTNLETVVNVSPIPTSRIHSSHPSALILGDPTSAVQTRSKDEPESESDGIPEAEKKFKQLESDEEMARKIQEEWEGEEERNRIAEEKAANEALIRNIDDIKARIEADRLLAEKLQEQEREQFSIEEKAKFLHDTIAAQRKFLTQQRSEAIRNRPPTKNQLRNQMMTYLKHIKRSDEDFISIGSAKDERLIKKMNEKGVDSSKSEVLKEESKEEVQKESKEEESTRKRKLGTRKKMKSRKRRYIQNTSEDDSEKENDELRLHLTIAPDEEKEVDYEILDRKYPIKEWKTKCLGTKPQIDQAEDLEEINHNVVIRSNGQKRYFSTLMRVLSIFDREDLNVVYQLVMDRFQDEIPEGFDRNLKDMVKALLLDKKSQAPAPVKAVEENCVTCGGAHSLTENVLPPIGKFIVTIFMEDQNDPHDDAHPEGENSAKMQKTSEHGTYVFRESSSGQVNKSKPGPSTSSNQEQLDDFDFWTDSYATYDDELLTEKVLQELVEEMSQTVDEAKLCKVVDEMLRQRCTSGDEHQYHIDQMQNFLKNDIMLESRKEILSLPFP
ncbi:synaptobrevin, longin-like domain protein [Tanacetum coccineum]